MTADEKKDYGPFVGTPEYWEAKNRRADNLDKVRAMVDKADSEKRAMTNVEKVEWDRLINEADILGRKIRLTEINDAEWRAQAARDFGVFETTGIHLRGDDGKTIAAARHGESYRAALGLRDSGFSIGKLVFGMVTNDWRGASDERAVYSQGMNASGGVLVPQDVSGTFIDLARAQSVVSQAGAMTVPMTSESLRVALVESDPTAYWTAENAAITESEGTFGAIELRTRALAVYCTCSLELIRNAANAQSIIENTISKAMALKLDYSCLNGAGAGEEPVGLLYSDRVQTSAVGGGFTYDALLNAMALGWAVNVEPTSWVMGTSLRKVVSKIKDGDGLTMALPPEAASLRKYHSNQLASADANGTCYVGDFSNCLIGIRSGIEIEVSNVADYVFKRKQVAIRGLMFADFAVARANDIVKMTGIVGG
jgi:HK97 family phage major capsid protein